MSFSLHPLPVLPTLSALQGALSGLASLAAGAPPVLRVLSGAHARLLRCWDGRVPDQWFGARLLVLETIGRRSGRVRSTPLVYVRSGEDLVVVATNAGADRQPDWWCNLRSAGEAIAVVDGRRVRVVPRESLGVERDRLWGTLARRAPIEAYQRRTARTLPVVVLSPRRASQQLPPDGWWWAGPVHLPTAGGGTSPPAVPARLGDTRARRGA